MEEEKGMKPVPERSRAFPEKAAQSVETPPPADRGASSARQKQRSKCPGLRDFLGNYSDQTGSFFG